MEGVCDAGALAVRSGEAFGSEIRWVVGAAVDYGDNVPANERVRLPALKREPAAATRAAGPAATHPVALTYGEA